MYNKKQLKVELSEPYVEGMSQLLDDGLYESRAEIVKDALRRLMRHYGQPCISDCFVLAPKDYESG